MRVAKIFSIRLPGVSSQCWRFENRVWDGRPFPLASLRDAATSRNFTYEKEQATLTGFETYTALSRVCAIPPQMRGELRIIYRARNSLDALLREIARFWLKSAAINALAAFAQNRRIADSRRITQFRCPNLSETARKARKLARSQVRD
jgi:hypothetical protein